MSRLVIFIIMVFLFQSAYAIADERFPFAEAYMLSLKKKITQNDRLTIGDGFNKTCAQINRKIPSLSPSERQWLDAEMQAGRVQSLLSSVELAKQTTRSVFSNCALFGIVLSISSSSTVDVAFVGNAWGWSQLLRDILTPSLSIRLEILNNKKVANFSKSELATVSSFPDIAHRVLSGIIIPLLKSEIDKGKKN